MMIEYYCKANEAAGREIGKMEAKEYEANRDQAIWNDGFKAGMREIADWIAEYVTNRSVNPTIFPRTAWQQKCKEWGIEL